MDETALARDVVPALREAGARFAFLHGSRAAGTARPGSDWDVAAVFGADAQVRLPCDVLLPPGVDLLVLDHAPLELRGRVAVAGVLLFSDDEPARVRWQATTRKIYFDELPRLRRAHRDFAEAVLRGR